MDVVSDRKMDGIKMLKLTYDEFVEEVKAEMYGYEEIGETNIAKWFESLNNFVKAKKKSTIFTYKGEVIEVALKDESDLFMIVDRYLAAVVNEELDKYYTNWTL